MCAFLSIISPHTCSETSIIWATGKEEGRLPHAIKRLLVLWGEVCERATTRGYSNYECLATNVVDNRWVSWSCTYSRDSNMLVSCQFVNFLTLIILHPCYEFIIASLSLCKYITQRSNISGVIQYLSTSMEQNSFRCNSQLRIILQAWKALDDRLILS